MDSHPPSAARDPSDLLDPTVSDVEAVAEMGLRAGSELLMPPAEPATAADPLAPLVRTAMRGDVQATRAVILSLGRQVRGACRAVLGGGHPDLDDTVQECFVGMIRALPAYRFEGDFSHYALRIAVRTALAARRRARLSRSRSEGSEPADDCVVDEVTPQATLLAAEKRALLRRLLDDLPEAQADALTLRVVFDFSIDQIASASGVSVNTVKTRLRLAKEALRRRIAESPALCGALGALP